MADREPLIDPARETCFPADFVEDVARGGFPGFVRRLPKADYAADGAGAIRGFVARGTCQVVFNENDEEVTFAPHRHAQSFGVVLAGECELVIDGVATRYKVGDTYHVPAGVLHYAWQSANYRDIVVFDEPMRVPVVADEP